MNNRHGSFRENDFDPTVIAWMKAHTVGDLKNLAREIESRVRIVNEMMGTVQALEGVDNGKLSRMGGQLD
jgi:hypothetical protein